MSLLQRLGLTAAERNALGGAAGKLKSVGDFLGDAIKAFEKVDFPEAIAAAAPWAEAFAESLAEAVPPVRFVVSIFKKLTEERDPDVLAYLACTLAYQRSLEQAFEAIGAPKHSQHPVEVPKQLLSETAGAEEMSFRTFSFGSALNHPFIAQCDALVAQAAQAVGYDQAQITMLTGEAHVRFVGNLKTILSHGSTREKFAPFTTRMQLDSREDRAYAALFEHADYQRRLFEEMPVLGKEPFALAHVYVETDCGVLDWDTISRGLEEMTVRGGRERKQLDPFSEEYGGREPLLDKVLELIGSPDFRDAIVIQGVAGSGKSTFTLRLCTELIRQGLRPIRVRLRDLRLDRHVSDALPQAVRFDEEGEDRREVQIGTSEELFLDGTIFKESVRVGRSEICPWVIILDGWDEVSISASEGFKLRIDRLLNQVRSEYVERSGAPIRVILTGRPSAAVTDSTFLRGNTPVLTLRPLSPEKVSNFIERLITALKSKPLSTPEAYDWSIGDLDRFRPILSQYEQDFPTRSGSMEVLGLPLLAHLAFRFMSQWRGDLQEIVTSPTTLYRKLVDLTCEKAGKPADTDEDAAGRAYLSGSELRRILRETAAAMTAYGEESIPFVELALRLAETEDRLLRMADEAHREHILTSLMVSYFFKGGHTNLGAEFSHKSFREYLYAEQIVETLKGYAARVDRPPDERETYWETFQERDPRHDLSEKLAYLLTPQWLSDEVVAHLESLVEWEISRNDSSEREVPGRPTDALPDGGWTTVREALADLWDWWAEGVHLRPQPGTRRRGFTGFQIPPLAVELVDWAAPQHVDHNEEIPPPARMTTIDAHLGDALFRLSTLVHYHVAVRSGWLSSGESAVEEPDPASLWAGVSPVGEGPRRCQSTITSNDGVWIMFAPSRPDPRYFENYVARVNAAGWRPSGPFPLGANLRGIDLREVVLPVRLSREQYSARSSARRDVDWSYANLSGVFALGTVYEGHAFKAVIAKGLVAAISGLHEVMMDHANLNNAELQLSIWSESSLRSVSLNEADLERAFFRKVDLTQALLIAANLSRTYFEDTKLISACLRGADLSDAVFVDVDFRDADLTEVKLKGTTFRKADLSSARGLTKEQLESSIVDSDTKLPDGLGQASDHPDDGDLVAGVGR